MTFSQQFERGRKLNFFYVLQQCGWIRRDMILPALYWKISLPLLPPLGGVLIIKWSTRNSKNRSDECSTVTILHNGALSGRHNYPRGRQYANKGRERDSRIKCPLVGVLAYCTVWCWGTKVINGRIIHTCTTKRVSLSPYFEWEKDRLNIININKKKKICSSCERHFFLLSGSYMRRRGAT